MLKLGGLLIVSAPDLEVVLERWLAMSDADRWVAVAASLGRDPGGFESRRPTPHDQYGSRGRGGLRPVAVPRPFPAGRRVHEARDPVVARAAAPAQLIA